MAYSANRRALLADAPFDGEPWERQAQMPWKESSQAYAGFLMYRDMPMETRTLRKVGLAYAEKFQRSVEPACTKVRQWAAQYRWEERTAAFDNMMDAKDLAERKRQLIKRTRVHADVMAGAQEALLEPLRVYQDRLQEMADGLRGNGLRATKTDPATGLVVDEYTDEELILLGRATLKTVMEAQRAEREALETKAPTSIEENKRILSRGAIIKRMFSDPNNRQVMETMAFQVVEEERKQEQPG